MQIPKPGDKGEHVKTLQNFLLGKGYKLPVYGADGDWSTSPKSETLLAVLAWQTDHYVDGLLDNHDWQELKLTQPPAAQVDRKDFPKVPASYSDIMEIYGKPWDDVDAWWETWCGSVTLPAPLKRLTRRGKIYVNKDIVPVLDSIFAEICDQGLQSHIKTYDGCFNVRKIRGSARQWSIHSWALAIDINAATNSLGAKPTMHARIVEIFVKHGFVWGGNFRRKDGMHYQYAKA